MGDRLRAGNHLNISPSRLGQLSLLPSAGRELTTGQSAVMLCGRGVHGNGNSHSQGIPMGFPWDSHGNGSSFGLLMGMGIAYFIGEI